jgi:hypothetical protein
MMKRNNEKNLQKLHGQRKVQKVHNRKSLSCIFCVNDNKGADVGSVQIMCYILCYNSLINASNLTTKSRKAFISY